MTGTERAALRLALGWLRGSVLKAPQANRGDPECGVDQDVYSDAVDMLSSGSGLTPYLTGFHTAAALPRVHHRILRARLALYLRALLRAERGDLSRWTCPRHPGATVATLDSLWRREWWCSTERRWRLVEAGNEPVRRASIARPLWTLAPSTPEPMK